jgi:hypothetical protein
VVGALPEKAVRSAPYRFATLGSDRTEERYPFDPEKASECDKIPTHDRHFLVRVNHAHLVLNSMPFFYLMMRSK